MSSLLARFSKLPLLVVVAILLTGCTFNRFSSRGDASEGAGLLEVPLERVVDGDTIVVSYEGQKEYVRLIGIDAPESVAPENTGKENTVEGVAASDYLKGLLEGHDSVFLQEDVSDRDRYDRLLRYVWLSDPFDTWDEDEIQNKMVNAILVKEGFAEVKRYEPDVLYYEILKGLE